MEVIHKVYMDKLSTLLREYQKLGFHPLAPVPRNLVELNRFYIVMRMGTTVHRLVGTYRDHETTIKLLRANKETPV